VRGGASRNVAGTSRTEVAEEDLHSIVEER